MKILFKITLIIVFLNSVIHPIPNFGKSQPNLQDRNRRGRHNLLNNNEMPAVTVSSNKTQVSVGVDFQITINTEGVKEYPKILNSYFGELEVKSIKRKTSFPRVSGKLVENKKIIYTLSSKAPGVFIIGPFELDVDGIIIITDPIQILILKTRTYQCNVFVSISKKKVDIGEKFQVYINCPNTIGFPKIISYHLEDFIVEGPKRSTSFNFGDGNMVSENRLIFTCTSRKEGINIIGPFEIEVDGKIVVTDPIKIMVSSEEYILKPPKFDIFVDVLVEKSTVSIGVPFEIEFRLCTQGGALRQYSIVNKPVISGSWIRELPLSKTTQLTKEQIGGKFYRCFTAYKIELIPLIAGDNTIGSLELVYNVSKRKEKFSIVSSPKQFNVTNSDTYLSDVSSFTAIIDTNDISLGNYIKLQVSLITNGFAPIHSPRKDLYIPNAEVFGPLGYEISDNYHKFEYDYIIIPLKTGEYKIPSLRLEYFDSFTQWNEIIITKQYMFNVR